MRFREFMNSISQIGDLFEAKIKPKFQIKLGDKEVTIIRDYHVMRPRGNSTMPRDSGMSVNKYEKILNSGISHIDKSKSFTLTWTSNSKSYAISGEFQDGTDSSAIRIFGAIMGRKEKPESLYKAAGTNRYHVGEVNFS